MGLEAHRYNQPYCMGTLYWQYNDCWPVASWSSRDYYGNWKALNYAVKQAFSPLTLSISQKANNSYEIWGVSEIQNNIIDSLIVEVYSLDGHLVFSKNQLVEVQKNTSTLLIKDLTILTPNTFIIARLKKNEIKSHFQFTSKPKNIILSKPNIKFKWEGNKLFLQTDIPAFHVYLHGLDGHFSNNFLTLMPGKNYVVDFGGDLSQKNKLLIWSLYNIY